MIGVFDSWLWWVQSLLYFKQHLPDHNFLFLWDSAYVPYGEKSWSWIHDRTFACLEWLFAQWCELVILACNTASAYAIRDRQQRFPDRKVLSVTVPAIEALVAWWYHCPLLLATQATIETHIYESVRERLFSDYPVVWHITVGRWWVEAIESWMDEASLRDLIRQSQLERFASAIDSVILWCTHYPLIQDILHDIFPHIPLINPARESSLHLSTYLARHHLWASTWWLLSFVVTGDADLFAKKIHRLWWMDSEVDHTDIV